MATKCVKDRCYSPVACGGFGYCRELNMLPERFTRARILELLLRAGVPLDEATRITRELGR